MTTSSISTQNTQTLPADPEKHGDADSEYETDVPKLDNRERKQRRRGGRSPSLRVPASVSSPAPDPLQTTEASVKLNERQFDTSPNRPIFDFHSERRNKLPLSSEEVAKLELLIAALCENPPDSEAWMKAYDEIVSHSWYLELAGNFDEFREKFSASVPIQTQSEPAPARVDEAVKQESDADRPKTQPLLEVASLGGPIDDAAERRKGRSKRKAKDDEEVAGSRSESDLVTKDNHKLDRAEPHDLNETGSLQPEQLTADNRHKTKGTTNCDEKIDMCTSSDEPTSMTYWVARINDQIARSASALIELGQMFVEAKSKLLHGEWNGMFESGRLKFSLRTAQKLMQVAANKALAKAKNSALLPPSLDALTTLARLDPNVVQSGIDDGVIRSDMTIADVRRYVLDQPGQEDKPAKNEREINYEVLRNSWVKRLRKALEKVPSELVGKLINDLIVNLRTFVP